MFFLGTGRELALTAIKRACKELEHKIPMKTVLKTVPVRKSSCTETLIVKDSTPKSRKIDKRTKRDREIEDAFGTLGLLSHQERMKFLRFSEEGTPATTQSYITYFSVDSVLSSSIV